jgi:hypothetical protein
MDLSPVAGEGVHGGQLVAALIQAADQLTTRIASALAAVFLLLATGCHLQFLRMCQATNHMDIQPDNPI